MAHASRPQPLIQEPRDPWSWTLRLGTFLEHSPSACERVTTRNVPRGFPRTVRGPFSNGQPGRWRGDVPNRSIRLLFSRSRTLLSRLLARLPSPSGARRRQPFRSSDDASSRPGERSRMILGRPIDDRTERSGRPRDPVPGGALQDDPGSARGNPEGTSRGPRQDRVSRRAYQDGSGTSPGLFAGEARDARVAGSAPSSPTGCPRARKVSQAVRDGP